MYIIHTYKINFALKYMISVDDINILIYRFTYLYTLLTMCLKYLQRKCIQN